MPDLDARLGSWRAGRYALFLRPRQWPILTCQFLVAAVLAPGVPRQLGVALGAQGPDWRLLFAAWVAWVVCLNGGTLAFNSAYDRDTEDIAYLRRPPTPPPALAAASLALMLAGIGLAFTVTRGFGLVTAGCVVLSVLYSHPSTRWKGIPGLDLAVNMFGYGGGTTAAGLCAGQAAWAASTLHLASGGWLLVTAFALLFGSFYPLSQLYQLGDDARRRDRTLACALGARGALLLALALGLAAAPLFVAAATRWPAAGNPTGWLSGAWPRTATGRELPWLLILALTAWCAHIWRWRAAASRWGKAQHERGMYRALALWAAVDVALLVHRFAGR